MILDHDMKLHVDFCAAWGIREDELKHLPEATGNMAYTRYVQATRLEVGFWQMGLDCSL